MVAIQHAPREPDRPSSVGGGGGFSDDTPVTASRHEQPLHPSEPPCSTSATEEAAQHLRSPASGLGQDRQHEPLNGHDHHGKGPSPCLVQFSEGTPADAVGEETAVHCGVCLAVASRVLCPYLPVVNHLHGGVAFYLCALCSASAALLH